MKPSRIALFAIVLFVLHVLAGTLTALAVGADVIGALMVSELVTGVLVSVCVFGYMSWLEPVLLAADILSLLVSAMLGVSAGVVLRRRGSTSK